MAFWRDGRSLVIELYEHRSGRERAAVAIVFNRENEAVGPICEWGHSESLYIYLTISVCHSLKWKKKKQKETNKKKGEKSSLLDDPLLNYSTDLTLVLLNRDETQN